MVHKKIHDLTLLSTVLDGFRSGAQEAWQRRQAREQEAQRQHAARLSDLDSAAAALQGEIDAERTRRRTLAKEALTAADDLIRAVSDPHFHRVKNEYFAQARRQGEDCSHLSVQQLEQLLQQRTAQLSRQTGKLKSALIPAPMAGAVGRVFHSYRSDPYRRVAQLREEIISAARRLADCPDLREREAFAAGVKQNKQEEFTCLLQQQLAPLPQRTQARLAELGCRLEEELEELARQGMWSSSHPLALGEFCWQWEGQESAAFLPEFLRGFARQDSLCFPVTAAGFEGHTLFLTRASLSRRFMLWAAALVEQDPEVEIFFADPEDLGSRYASAAALSEGGKVHIWSSEGQLTQGLEGLCQSIARHNAAGGQTPQRLRKYLFIDRLERSIPPRELEKLCRVVRNGLNAGVCVILSMDGSHTPGRELQQALPQMAHYTHTLTLEGTALALSEGGRLDFSPCDPAPAVARARQALEMRRQRTALLPLGPQLPPAPNWRTRSSADGILLPLGQDRQGHRVCLLISEDKPYALIIGDPDMGKSSLLHTICLQTMANYSHSEVKLAIGDFKMGAEFNLYAAANLPSVEAVVSDEDPDVMASFLGRYVSEMALRQEQFDALETCSGRPVRKYETYRAVWEELGRPTPEMPRILLIIDEFQSLFDGKSPTAPLMETLVRNGRTYGIHIIMASQRAVSSNPSNTFSSQLKGFFTHRFLLRCPQSAARAALSERCADTGRENSGIAAASMLNKGQVILNTYMGELESANHTFQCFYPSDETVSLCTRALSAMDGPGSSILLRSNAKSPAPTVCGQWLELGVSPCLHKDALAVGCDDIIDDTAVSVEVEGSKTLLITGADVRVPQSAALSAARWLAARGGGCVHVFGAPNAPLVRALSAAQVPGCSFCFHTTPEAQSARLTTQLELGEVCVNIFADPDTGCFAQPITALRPGAEVQLLKQVLESGCLNLLCCRSFRDARTNLSYAIPAAAIRLTAIGDTENLRAAMGEHCRLTPSAFDVPHKQAIKAYYYNKNTEKQGKVILFAL